ncbi:9175_t:CDS:2 [Diversispora eburnea]|uniref:9175_t:CDS:1 n=1 Tax=Diversispora eburnea TaxID=1213867 RepID=A0A9N8ZX52_9GLOM|nr:9175_t:CDS:2 [Diversispora eburnea]
MLHATLAKQGIRSMLYALGIETALIQTVSPLQQAQLGIDDRSSGYLGLLTEKLRVCNGDGENVDCSLICDLQQIQHLEMIAGHDDPKKLSCSGANDALNKSLRAIANKNSDFEKVRTANLLIMSMAKNVFISSTSSEIYIGSGNSVLKQMYQQPDEDVFESLRKHAETEKKSRQLSIYFLGRPIWNSNVLRIFILTMDFITES